MDTPESGNKFVAYVRANRAFFVFLGVIVLATFGYFWWRAGFTLEFSKFFASCETGDCDDDGYDNPFVRGDDCDDGDPGIPGDRSCRWCQASQVQGGETCGDGDCDDDGHDNPSVGGDDCDDGNWCNSGGGCGQPQTHLACQGNACVERPGGGGDQCSGDGDCAAPTYTCEDNGNQCVTGACPGGYVNSGDTCQSGHCCQFQGGGGQSTATLVVSPHSVPVGGTVNITWNSNGTGCHVEGGNFGDAQGNIPPNGSATEGIAGSPGQQVGFRISCTGGPSGSVFSGVETVTLNGDPLPNQHVECDPVQAVCKLRDGSGANAPDCNMGTIDQPCQVERHLACVQGSGAPACALVEGGSGNRDGCITAGDACTVPGGSGICAGYPDRWGSNGVVVCRISSNFVNDRCTTNGDGHSMYYTVGIFNGSTEVIYSKPAIFFTPNQTCGAHADNPGGTGGIRDGPDSIARGDSAQVTYNFTPGDCGSYQLDDTWGPGNFVFVIGNVINTGRDCSTPASHLVCQNNACTSVAGAGANQCAGEGSSCGTTATHNVCQSNACVPVSGGGADQCSSAADCATPTHLACVNNACVPVSGGGANQCTSAADCVTPTHNVCQNNACVPVTGGGPNQCSSAADCQTATHTVCSNNACTRVNGVGTNECATDPDCRPIPPLNCASIVTQANVGQAVPFSATGGTGSYSWYAPGSTPPNGGGTPFQATYSVPGFKTVTVASGGQQATCTVTITAPQTSTPPTALVCTPTTQNVTSGSPATVTAAGGTPNYTWSAPDGVPSSQRDGTSFSPTFTIAGETPQTFPVTVTDAAGRSAVCNVTVGCVPPPCPAPQEGCTYQGGTACSCGTLVCPSGAPLVCSPINQDVSIGQSATIDVGGGGVRTFSWSAPNGNPSSGSGPATRFSTRYGSAGNYQVTVSGGGQTATCNVRVRSSSPPPTTITPPPTSPHLSIEKTVRNITANGPDTESASADPGNTVEFTIRVSSDGNGTARNVIVRDALPAGLNYQAGTTTVDGAVAADGITGSGISLGDMPSGRTVVIRFRAIVADASFFTNGTTTLVNTAFARGSNTNEVSDNAQVVVTRGQGLAMSLTKLGRNVTRGESGEHSPVQSSPGQTIEFFIHVRNTSAATLTNVVVRDLMPERITFIPGTVHLNGQPAADTLVTSGLPIGSLAAGAEAVITFSGKVAGDAEFAAGSVTLINTAQASADGVPMLQAQLPIVVTKGAVVTVPTGPGESTLLALIISALITLLYVGYTSTESFRRREAAGLAGHAHDDKGLFDFKR